MRGNRTARRWTLQMLVGLLALNCAWGRAWAAESGGAAWLEQAPLYSASNAPPTPALASLESRDSITQYGITWTFAQPVKVGRFVCGDWYVVGPVTVKAIDPLPLWGPEAGAPDKGEKGPARNGSMLNPPAKLHRTGIDSRVKWFMPELFAKLPLSLNPGDALLSSISLDKPEHSGYVVKTYAVLTCLKEPVPPDAFRPGYCDREQSIHLARNLKRDLRQQLPKVKDTPSLPEINARFARPWLETGFLEDAQAVYQERYGRAICQLVSRITLLQMLDFTPQEKEPSLLGVVQYGIDLFGVLKGGLPGWPTLGGWGSGRKWPIVFAGLMLGDEQMAHLTRTFPDAEFQENDQVLYDDCWTGAGVAYAGHTGYRKTQTQVGWGSFEHLHPTRWMGWIGTSYRGNMTSSTWVGEALAVRMYQAEKEWERDPFFDYCDRWMTEADPGYRNPNAFSTQGRVMDTPFIEQMWKAYRSQLPNLPGHENPPRPTTGWQKKRELRGPAVEIGAQGQFTVKGAPFVPLMIFAEHPKRIEDALSIGANVLAEGSFENPESFNAWRAAKIRNDRFLDELQAKGLYGIFGADARTIGHPALLGWIHLDQPDVLVEKAAAMDLKQGKIFAPNYYVMTTAKSFGVPAELKDLPDQLLMVQPAYRWMKQMDASRPVFLTLGETFFKQLALGKTDLGGAYFKCADAVGCRVAPERIGDAVSKLHDLAGPGKAVYAWVATKGLSAAQVSAQVRAAITKGATALGYLGFEGYGEERPQAAVLAELKRLNALIVQHWAELLADPSKADALLK